MITISLKFYRFLKWLLFLVAVFFIAGLLLGSFYYVYDDKYKERYFPGTRIAGMKVDGLKPAEVEEILNKKIDAIIKSGIDFKYHNQEATLDLLLTSAGADIARPVIEFEIEEALKAAYEHARSDSWLYNARERMRFYNSGMEFPIQVITREPEINDFLDEYFSHFSTPAKDAKLVYEFDDYGKTVEYSVEEEVYGQALNLEAAIHELNMKLKRLDSSMIVMDAQVEYPQVYKKDCFNIEKKAGDIVELAPLTLRYEDDEWEIEKEDILELLSLKKESEEVIVALDEKKVKEYFEENIAEDINRLAMDAKFEVVDGRVEQFQVNKDGQELDTLASFDALQESVKKASSSIDLVVNVISGKSSTEEMENMGIKEILGTGHSNFAGSPVNRRHNIAVGASSVNGSLIAPGEEFSLLNTLGEINGETGYRQELVIKGNKTIPEYGGGLCQIGTTVFRATVESGLPVTMRRNHSYRVSYYEPAGTDATIYDPWPDYKFKNDTSHHILIQSRIEGDDLYFDFWGTKDGRIASSTYPVIYNIVKPGPTKIIETLDLEPGVKKCMESSHNGADAYFDYSIQYPDGELAEERFKSHYVPWQAVCLLGVEELSSEKSASSSDEVVLED